MHQCGSAEKQTTNPWPRYPPLLRDPPLPNGCRCSFEDSRNIVNHAASSLLPAVLGDTPRTAYSPAQKPPASNQARRTWMRTLSAIQGGPA